jgi:hypothetical protein
MRMRPGERPSWTDASPWQERWQQWRECAQDAGVGVEIAVAVMLEYELVLIELQGAIANPATMLSEAAESELAGARLAPDQDYRAWSSVLLGAGTPADELPEIALPQRLLRTPLLRSGWGDLLARAHLSEALLCERAATAHALTLELWAMRAALSHLAAEQGHAPS